MKAINEITQFFLKHMLEIEQNRVGGDIRLIDVYNNTRENAKKAGLSDEDADNAAFAAANLGVAMNVTMNLNEMLQAAATAGKVLIEIADPDLVKQHQPLKTPEELKKAAREAANYVTVLLKLLKGLLPAVNEEVDNEHIVERLLAAGREARAEKKAAEPTVKAKPVSGEVTPFGRRIEPSQN